MIPLGLSKRELDSLASMNINLDGILDYKEARGKKISSLMIFSNGLLGRTKFLNTSFRVIAHSKEDKYYDLGSVNFIKTECLIEISTIGINIFKIRSNKNIISAFEMCNSFVPGNITLLINKNGIIC